ncbi:hypothetical protein BOTBODRAFT_629299 [Botryobasidium botryosum FD-172 SS1]|uniref:PRMT5 TIM barrel domain-containing protein n=1 Tax=Botryobasidium botryosum (strain FD-172 SS1) TaxID=930990 RepID=A0A067MFQ6_BOTB1|nr:hypothetical protein BOTBODRAFT_629299 [Botryobasidium botryosum FD-172 SS1]
MSVGATLRSRPPGPNIADRPGADIALEPKPDEAVAGRLAPTILGTVIQARAGGTMKPRLRLEGARECRCKEDMLLLGALGPIAMFGLTPSTSLNLVRARGQTSSRNVPSFESRWWPAWVRIRPLRAGSPPQSLVAPNEDTAIHQLVNDALSKNYSSICVPLANDAWKERWRSMCLKSSPSAPNSSSMATKPQTEKAERWRAGGCFLRGEVNLSRIDEAERVIGMASDWLELDSPDERVKFDSEVVSANLQSHRPPYTAYLTGSIAGSSAGALPRVVPQHGHDCARAINACLTDTGLSQYRQLSVRIPARVPSEAIAQTAAGFPARRDVPALSTHSPPGQSAQLAPTALDPVATWETK